jgi:hypothetical protein
MKTSRGPQIKDRCPKPFSISLSSSDTLERDFKSLFEIVHSKFSKIERFYFYAVKSEQLFGTARQETVSCTGPIRDGVACCTEMTNVSDVTTSDLAC